MGEFRRNDWPREKILEARARAREHARLRARERCGYDFDRTERRWFEYVIQFEYDPYARCLGAQTHERTVWAVRRNESEYPVVFDSALNTVVTFLPREAVEFDDEGRIKSARTYLRPTLKRLSAGRDGEINGE